MEAITFRSNNMYTNYNRDALRAKRNIRRKHIQDLKRRLVLAICALILIVIMGTVFGTFMSKAEAENQMPEYKYFKTYTVQVNDSLWEIANEYTGTHYTSNQEYIQEVMQMNHLQSEYIQAGDVIVIPYFSTDYQK